MSVGYSTLYNLGVEMCNVAVLPGLVVPLY